MKKYYADKDLLFTDKTEIRKGVEVVVMCKYEDVKPLKDFVKKVRKAITSQLDDYRCIQAIQNYLEELE